MQRDRRDIQMHECFDYGDAAEDDARENDGDKPFTQHVGVRGGRIEYGQKPAAAHANAGDHLDAVDNPDEGDICRGDEEGERVENAEGDGKIDQQLETVGRLVQNGALSIAVPYHREYDDTNDVYLDYKRIEIHRHTPNKQNITFL